MTRPESVTAGSQRTRDDLMPRALQGSVPLTGVPSPEDACRVTSILRDNPRWSAFWDKAYGVWRVAEDDPDSGLYAESSDAGTVIGYIQAHP
jgi:hypothetical protein